MSYHPQDGYVDWQDAYTGPKTEGKGGIFGVVNDQFGNPVPGAQITVTGSEGSQQVTANGDGVYGVGVVTPGSGYTITISSPGYDIGTLTGIYVFNGYATNKLPVLHRQDNGKILVGTIIDTSSGNPVNGATVTVTNGTETKTGTTGSDGNYTVTELPPDTTWELRISKEGYHTTKKSGVETKEWETVTENLRLVPKTPGKGAVIGKATWYPNGSLNCGATVTVYKYCSQYGLLRDPVSTTRTDVFTGEYSFEGLAPGTYWVALEDGNYQHVYVQECHAEVVELMQPEKPLVGEGAILGGVTDANTGKVVPGATVTVNNGETTKTATTDAGGKYIVTGLPPDKVWGIQVSREGYHTTEKSGTETSQGKTTTENQRLVPKTLGMGAVAGSVVDENGNPLAGIKVKLLMYALGEIGLVAEFTTNANGEFTMPGLAVSVYFLEIEGDRSYFTVRSPGLWIRDCHTSLYTFTILPIGPSGTGALTGKVVDASTGKSVTGATITATQGSGTGASKMSVAAFTTITGDGGNYSFVDLPSGYLYTLAISGNGVYTATLGDVDVRDGEATVRKLYTSALESAGTGAIGGRVFDWRTNGGISGAEVTVTPGNLSAQTNLDGLWTVTGLSPGTYAVNITALGYAEKTLPGVEAAAGEMNALGVAMGEPDAILPPTNVAVTDAPDDQGYSLKISWKLSVSDSIVTEYRVYRSRIATVTEPAIDLSTLTTLTALLAAEEGSTIFIGSVPGGTAAFTDPFVPVRGATYYYWVQAVSVSGFSAKVAATAAPVSVEDKTPSAFQVSGFYPNPFNPSTAIRFTVPEECRVTLEMYDVLGRKVATLANGGHSAGTHSVVWDGRDDKGSMAGSGVYLYRLRAGAHTAGGKVMFLR